MKKIWKILLLTLFMWPVFVEAQVPDNDGEYTLTFPMGGGIDEYALDDVEFNQDFGYYPDFYELTVKARSKADSVIFDHYGPEHFERHVNVPDSGFVYDTLHTSRLDTIHTIIRAYHNGSIYSTRRTYKYADHFWAVAKKRRGKLWLTIKK